MIIWWTVMGVLCLEDLLTKHVTIWLLWILFSATVFSVAFSGFSNAGRMRGIAPFLLLEKGLCFCVMAGCLFVSCRRKKVGWGDLFVILMTFFVFPITQIMWGLLFGCLHAGILGILRMAFYKEKSPRIPLLPLLGTGLWLGTALGFA